MITWLHQNGIVADETFRKTTLYELIKAKKRPEKVFKIDMVFEAHGHTVVRLPPYNCDLNPMELAWAKLKRHIRSKNVTGELTMTKLKELIDEGKLNKIILPCTLEANIVELVHNERVNFFLVTDIRFPREIRKIFP